MNAQPTAKARAGPARNPGTPRPGARRHGKRKNPPNNNMIQSSNSKTIYTQLSRAVTRCSGAYEIKISTLRMQVWNTNPVRSLKREYGLPRMTPGLPFIYSSRQYSSWKRPLQRNESSAVQTINPGHQATSRSPIDVATRDDPRPALLAHKSIMQSESMLIYPGRSPGRPLLIPYAQQI